MLRNYLLMLLVLAVGASAAFLLYSDSGYVLISFRSWLIESSLLGFLAAVLFSLALLYYGGRLLWALLKLPSLLRSAARERRSARAQRSFETGLLKLLEGNWRRAEVELVRYSADHHAQHLNYLAAARAAQRLGAGDRRDHYLRLAAQSAPEMEFATLLTQAELQRERGEHVAARETALKLRGRDATHPYAIELLAESYAAIGQWPELLDLLLEKPSAEAVPPARYRELLIAALVQRLRAAIAAARLDQLKAVWERAPAAYRAEAEVRALYARGLARLNADAEALALIASTLDRTWDAELAMLYGELHAADPVGQLASVEQWLKQHGERTELLVTAGRACLRNKLWGKARSYLEAVTRVAPSAAAYLELARLCEQTQASEEAQQFYRKGLEHAAQD
jgi:HemY protein